MGKNDDIDLELEVHSQRGAIIQQILDDLKKERIQQEIETKMNDHMVPFMEKLLEEDDKAFKKENL